VGASKVVPTPFLFVNCVDYFLLKLLKLKYLNNNIKKRGFKGLKLFPHFFNED
jgi:hypothetical protein